MEIQAKIIEKIIDDTQVRREVVRDSHQYFFPIYFGEYIKYPSAPFHEEMLKMTESEKHDILGVVAFRGSAKSTIFSLSYPIWAILGKQQKKFIVIISQTQTQAKLILKNIKDELERNQLLKQDLGPFEEAEGEWNSGSIIIPKYDARIMVASVDQSIRGSRHGSYRPDLIILDDVQDLQSAQTRESREKTKRWFTGEIVPAGDLTTRIVMIGNLVHEDCLLMNIKEQIDKGERDGIFRRYPIVNDEGVPAWPEKFTSQEILDQEKAKVMNPQAWQREYMLRIIPDEAQVIHKEWIKYYDYEEKPGTNHNQYSGTFSSVDLAISQKAHADYTAMVTAHVFETSESYFIYILPHPVNKRMTFPEQMALLEDHAEMNLQGSYDKLFIEAVGYQEALIQQLDKHNIDCEAIVPKGDKRSRLALTTQLISEGKILFPEEGCEELIAQLVGFGVEKHDDLADAFSMLIHGITKDHLGGYALPVFVSW